MTHNNTSSSDVADPIREWVEQYRPRLMSAQQQQRFLPPLRELVLAVGFDTLSTAKAAMSRTVRFLAEMAPPDEAELADALTELNLAAWSSANRGHTPPAASEVSSVRHLLNVAQRLERPALRSTPADRHLPPFSSDDDTRMVAAVVGAGLSGPEAVGAAVEISASGEPYVRLDGGGTRTIDPALIERMGTLPPGPVRTAGWRRFADAAAQRGVQLTQYRARDAWAARVLAALRAVQEPSAPVRHFNGRPGGDLVTGRRASRAEVKRRVQAARDDAGNIADLPAPLARILDGYVPDRCDSDAWTAIRPTVRAVMERSASRSPAPFRKQLGALAAYLRWRHSNGLDVAVSSAMTFAAIDDFYRRVGDRYEQTTRNDYRSRLRRLAQQVNPGIDPPREGTHTQVHK